MTKSKEAETLNHGAGDVWIDMTDFAAWQGHFSGIQRVVFSYAERYYKNGGRYFIYKRLSRRFVEVHGGQFFEVGPGGKPNTRTRVKLFYRSVMPRFIRKLTTPLIRKVLHYIFAAGALLAYVTFHKNIFSEDDKVLILGAGWESKNMITDILKHKSETKFKLVQLWHDLLPISQPHLFDKKLVQRQINYTRQALKGADLIISVSRATEKDVMGFAAEEGIALPPHSVIREGEDSYEATKSNRPKQLKNIDGPFIFSLGTLEVRKNHQLIYQAYKLAQQQGIKLPRLIIVGRPGWLAHDFLAILRRDKSLFDQIIVLRGLPDEEVSWLFENCLFSIYPSLCEGWGLTIAESLGKGKLCLTGDVSSMPEVAGDMADYFSPYNSQECLEKIREYVDSPEKLKAKENLIKDYKPFSWDDSWQQLDAAISSTS